MFKVVKFLKATGVAEEVIETFKKEKVSSSSVHKYSWQLKKTMVHHFMMSTDPKHHTCTIHAKRSP